jgi:uncharacterized protein (TIGR03067 family)
MVRTLLLGGALVVLCAAGAAADDAAKEDLDKFQGEWQMVSSTRDGKELPAEDVEKMTRVVKGDSYRVLREGKEVVKGTITVDPSKKPKTVDAAREGTDQPALGIYEFDGDKQKICFALPGKDRPTEFSAKEGSGRILTVWKRKK